jgi:hypothetical protein
MEISSALRAIAALVAVWTCLDVASPASAQSAGENPRVVKVKYGCITEIAHDIGPVRDAVSDALRRPVEGFSRDCVQGMTLAIRVSPFGINSSQSYPIERDKRYESALGEPYRPGRFNDGFVLFVQTYSPIEDVRHSSANGAAKIFRSRFIASAEIDCVMSSLSADGPSAILDISLYRMAFFETQDGYSEVQIDRGALTRNTAVLRYCLAEFSRFIALQ